MRENEEALAMQQKESLRSFAEDIYNKVGSRITSAVLTHDGLCYTIEFNTADRFSLVLMGSETNNADCFQSMLVFDGFSDLLLSDRSTLEEYKAQNDGTWETVSVEHKLTGFGAILLLWKSSEDSLNFNLAINDRQ